MYAEFNSTQCFVPPLVGIFLKMAQILKQSCNIALMIELDSSNEQFRFGI